MRFVPYDPAFNEALDALFYHTVHTTNAADYTPPQLDAWAPPSALPVRWTEHLKHHYTLLALDDSAEAAPSDKSKILGHPLMGFASLQAPAPLEDIALLRATAANKAEVESLPDMDFALLDHLFVHPRAQGQHLGVALTSQMEAQALAQGCRIMLTFASLTAQGFFRSQGYEIIHRQEVERYGQKLANALMRKDLA